MYDVIGLILNFAKFKLCWQSRDKQLLELRLMLILSRVSFWRTFRREKHITFTNIRCRGSRVQMLFEDSVCWKVIMLRRWRWIMSLCTIPWAQTERKVNVGFILDEQISSQQSSHLMSVWRSACFLCSWVEKMNHCNFKMQETTNQLCRVSQFWLRCGTDYRGMGAKQRTNRSEQRSCKQMRYF